MLLMRLDFGRLETMAVYLTVTIRAAEFTGDGRRRGGSGHAHFQSSGRRNGVVEKGECNLGTRRRIELKIGEHDERSGTTR